MCLTSACHVADVTDNAWSFGIPTEKKKSVKALVRDTHFAYLLHLVAFFSVSPKCLLQVTLHFSELHSLKTVCLHLSHCICVSMPSRRNTSASFVSTRGSAAVFRARIEPLCPVPPIEMRGSVWSGWCPRIFEELCAMNPLAFWCELLRRRRTQSTTDDLPAFSRDSCLASRMQLFLYRNRENARALCSRIVLNVLWMQLLLKRGRENENHENQRQETKATTDTFLT